MFPVHLQSRQAMNSEYRSRACSSRIIIALLHEVTCEHADQGTVLHLKSGLSLAIDSCEGLNVQHAILWHTVHLTEATCRPIVHV
jgi:hypothetical protein